MNRAKLDAWITGNYGEDHPDNQQNRYVEEADRIAAAHLQRDAYEKWLRRFETDETTERK